MSEQKPSSPREWWLQIQKGDWGTLAAAEVMVWIKKPPEYYSGEIAHVIEYSAYEELSDELMQLRFQKDPEIIDGVKELAIAHQKQIIERVRASRDECRDKIAELELIAVSCRTLLSEASEFLNSLVGNYGQNELKEKIRAALTAEGEK